MVAERYEDYWRGMPAMAGVELRFVSDANARILAVQNRAVKSARGDGTAQVDPLAAGAGSADPVGCKRSPQAADKIGFHHQMHAGPGFKTQ